MTTRIAKHVGIGGMTGKTASPAERRLAEI
jgi:hypothetical protein